MPPRQAVLGVENASFFHGSKRVFSGVSFLLDGARTGLVGENGAGKSTLLKCLTGELELIDGQIVRSRGLRVGYVPQEIPEALEAMSIRAVLEQALTRTGAEDEFWRVDVLLDELGVALDRADDRFGALSGGWQRLLLIAAAANLESPDILILDEPTNHLDIGHLNTLERWLLEDAKVPMLIVSHDRDFLNRVTERTLFLRADGAHAFKTPFIQAREELLRRDAADATRRKLETKEIERLEQVAARYKVWGVKNSDFHKKQKMTEKRIERIQRDMTSTYVERDRKLELHDADIEAKVALRVRDLKVTAPDGRLLLTIDRLNIGAGDRIALLGPNGAGKSTLLNVLAAAFEPDRAHYDPKAAIRFNPGCQLVYFDQRMMQLPLDSTLIDFVEAAGGPTTTQCMSLLAKAGFDHTRARSRIGELSFGERSRLIFLKMRLLKPNFYLLDEPTNHLDISGQEDLEAQLEASEVSCVFVSHDRFFTRTAATRFLEIRKGRLVETDGADEFFDRQTAAAAG
jgi:ATPase subunit of ABC transporter with duplicated ATPase domains